MWRKRERCLQHISEWTLTLDGLENTSNPWLKPPYCLQSRLTVACWRSPLPIEDGQAGRYIYTACDRWTGDAEGLHFQATNVMGSPSRSTTLARIGHNLNVGISCGICRSKGQVNITAYSLKLNMLTFNLYSIALFGAKSIRCPVVTWDSLLWILSPTEEPELDAEAINDHTPALSHGRKRNEWNAFHTCKSWWPNKVAKRR